ncbi:MAG: hypothetical protein NTY34_08465 [Candidatus Omnitrophica bacterium]|nr:hypothetical protein [Candidatus Omnitrophota bacterium]
MRKDRVLLSAILFSAVWHLFWLSALTVVVVPKDTKPPKFSSVSFLGPILETIILEVSSAVHERSIPEKRYLSEIENSSALIMEKAGPDAYTQADLGAGTDIFEADEMLTALVISAIDGNKMDPGSSQ